MSKFVLNSLSPLRLNSRSGCRALSSSAWGNTRYRLTPCPGTPRFLFMPSFSQLLLQPTVTQHVYPYSVLLIIYMPPTICTALAQPVLPARSSVPSVLSITNGRSEGSDQTDRQTTRAILRLARCHQLSNSNVSLCYQPVSRWFHRPSPHSAWPPCHTAGPLIASC